MKRFSFLPLLFLCAAAPVNAGDVEQANLDYQTDMDTIYAIADDYEDNPGFQVLLARIPYVYAPYQHVLEHRQKPSQKAAKGYIKKVGWLTQCASALEENSQELLPASCKKVKDGAPSSEDLGESHHHWLHFLKH